MRALSCTGISVRFEGLRALEDVTINLEPGERRAIIGTNGAGKTTLFNVVNGQQKVQGGTVSLFGQDITQLPPHRRAALGLARTFQITNLFPMLTVFESMVIAVQALHKSHFVFYRRINASREVLSRSRELLQHWQLWPVRDELVANLSYGVQRQLEIVLALASNPKLLLLDEPMAGLSASETHLATDIIRSLDRSVTVLLIEHDLAAVFRIADSITAMDRGQIVAEGTPDEIRGQSKLQSIYMRGDAQRARAHER